MTVHSIRQITSKTTCENCGQSAKEHCQEPFHFLQCCPGTCPAGPDEPNHFCPPIRGPDKGPRFWDPEAEGKVYVDDE